MDDKRIYSGVETWKSVFSKEPHNTKTSRLIRKPKTPKMTGMCKFLTIRRQRMNNRHNNSTQPLSSRHFVFKCQL